ncbi:P-loop containing nucleoside triphosphate hydrolase protein [Pisolithus thermaeus]|nr:P-loop containing nucleoside triphosphate hydrolase protein [Pisolithus thermaeus]
MMVDDAVLTVMVLGEIGVGKSSMVNLIVGEYVAGCSPDVEVCTRGTTKHEATVESMKLHIWEVSGFNKPEDLKKNAPDIEDKFGPMLEARASVNVILFCMRGQKVTATTKRILERIHGIFKKRIPIVLVINHLERERDMEDWWRRNQNTLGTSMSGTRHTCVTGLPDYEEKWRKSREELVAVLRSEYPSRERTAVPLESALRGHLRGNGQTDAGWFTWLLCKLGFGGAA